MKVFFLEPSGLLWKTAFELGGNSYDPVSIGYLGAFLKSKGIEVEVFQQRRETIEEVIEKVVDFQPDVLAVSTMTYNFGAGREICKKVKEKIPGIKVVFGGCHITADNDLEKYPEIDFAILGEGEHTLFELVKAIEAGRKDFAGIYGIAFKENEKVTVTKNRERIKDLDSLPFPIRRYLNECRIGAPMLPIPEEQSASAQITYSRGCTHSCAFCTAPLMWKRKIIYRSAKNAINEIEYLIKEFGVRAIPVTDLTFNSDRKKVQEFCNEITKRGIDVRWYPSCRITDDKDLLGIMHDAGCIKIAYGVESLNNEILDSINKETNFKDIKKCFEATNKVGIISRAFLMIGYPQESYETIQELKEKITELPADELRISFMTPYPGTQLYYQLKKENKILTNDFTKFDSDNPIIKTGLTPEELKKARKEIFEKFYSNEEFKERIKQKAKKFPELKKTYEDFTKKLQMG